MASVEDVRIIELPKFLDARGNLSFAEQNNHIPFEIKRTYWIYDVPAGESRGGHAHKALMQMLVPMSGSFKVVLNNGKEEKEVLLNHPWQCLMIVPGIWRTIEDFSSGAVCMCLASDHYDELDYIRDYDQFKALYGK